MIDPDYWYFRKGFWLRHVPEWPLEGTDHCRAALNIGALDGIHHCCLKLLTCAECEYCIIGPEHVNNKCVYQSTRGRLDYFDVPKHLVHTLNYVLEHFPLKPGAVYEPARRRKA